jgi:hypothetical protein
VPDLPADRLRPGARAPAQLFIREIGYRAEDEVVPAAMTRGEQLGPAAHDARASSFE